MTPIDKPIHPPREGDLPREELIAEAERVCQQGWNGLKVKDVLFKYTCQWCGERCTMQEPNKLYENGECFACGKSTPIKFGGFLLHCILEKA